MTISADLLDAAAKLDALLERAERLDSRMAILNEAASVSDVASGYESDLGDLVQSLLRGGHRLSKGAFRRDMRKAVKDWAKQMFNVAWEEGGGDIDETEADDLALLEDFTSEQQGYVSDFADWLTAKESDLDAVPDRLSLWAASLENFGGQIKARAMGDPSLTFDGDDGEESCDECQEWKGQTHRLSFWEKRGLTKRNGNENFGCKRFDNCHHSFFHTKTGEMVIP